MLLLFIVCTDFTLHTILQYSITLRLATVKIAPSSDYIAGLNNSQDRLINFMPHTTSLSFGQSHAQEKASTARLLRQITAKFVNRPGDALPSIRNLAQQLQISVITTKRAYDELERDGFIETVSGKGSFVAPQNPDMMREKRMNLIESRLSEVVKESLLLGLSLDELQQMLELLYMEV